MVRIKRGTTALKKRKSLLAKTKGYRNALSTKERAAREAHLHAGSHAFAHRRKKKGDFRRLWNVRINSAIRPLGSTYSEYIHILKSKNIKINRKMLALIAQKHPETFKRIFENTLEK